MHELNHRHQEINQLDREFSKAEGDLPHPVVNKPKHSSSNGANTKQEYLTDGNLAQTSGTRNRLSFHHVDDKWISSSCEELHALKSEFNVPDFLAHGSYRKGHSDAIDWCSVQSDLTNDLPETNLTVMTNSGSELCNFVAKPDKKNPSLVHESYDDSISDSGQLEYGKNQIIDNVNYDKQSDEFVEGDWDSFDDFDFNTSLRTSDSIDSIFGDQMIEISDGFMSASADFVDHSIELNQLLGIPPCKENSSEGEFSTLRQKELCEFIRSDHFSKEQTAARI